MDRGAKVRLAHDISDRLCARYTESIEATALYGSVARGDDTDLSDIDILVAARDASIIPGRRLLHGSVVVNVRVGGTDELLRSASTIDGSWPLRSSIYTVATPLHDPNGYVAELRARHDRAVATAPEQAFLEAAGGALAEAIAIAYKARAYLSCMEGAALVAVSEAAIAAVMSIGLAARFPYRNLSHAMLMAPRLPGVPEAFEEPFRDALAVGVRVEDAVKAIEDAVEVLLSAALERGIPFTADDADAFAVGLPRTWAPSEIAVTG